MGYYGDETSGQWGDDYNPAHRIVCTSGWAACTGSHETPAGVKDCYRKAAVKGAWPCSWLLEGHYDDWSVYTYECGALSRYTDDRGSYECEAGHNHIPADLMAERGIAYASDDGERDQLRRAGVQPLHMNGSIYN
jgi:hypothetical protein